MVDRWLGYRRASKGYKADPCAQVHPRILFGAGEFLTPQFVKKNNISHVINCAYEEDCPRWFPNQFPDNYYCVEASDSLSENILKWYPEFKSVMDDFLKEPNSKTVYVHCQCGINRSGFLSLLYICLTFGYNIDSAIRMILIQRPCALTNPSYMRQSLAYIKKHT